MTSTNGADTPATNPTNTPDSTPTNPPTPPTASAPDAHAETPQRALAIFDLDKTIINTSASMAYGRPLAERGLISTPEVLQMMALLGNYMLSTHTEENMNSTKDKLLGMIRNREEATLRNVTQEALQDVITPYIFAEARNLIAHHHTHGRGVAIVTASPSVIVEPIAEELGVDHLLATELEVKDGLFTGEVVHFNKGQAKVDRIIELAETHGYQLADSYAYTDSHTDLPMLELVGHPHAVNPDRPLRKIAQEHNWPISNFERPEPLFAQAAVLAGAGATLALLGAVATAVTLWYRSRED